MAPFAILFLAAILQATLFKYIGSAAGFLNFVLVMLMFFMIGKERIVIVPKLWPRYFYLRQDGNMPER